MTKKIIIWVVSVWERAKNNILYFFEKNFTNQILFYIFLFSISWFLVYNKFCDFQISNLVDLESYQLRHKKHVNDFLKVKNYIANNAILLEGDKSNYLIDENNILKIKNFIKNDTIDINLLSDHVEQLKKKHTKVAIWNEDWEIWKNYMLRPENSLKNIINYNPENDPKYKEDIKIANESIPKKIKIKLIFGLGLIILSDFALKLLNNN